MRAHATHTHMMVTDAHTHIRLPHPAAKDTAEVSDNAATRCATVTDETLTECVSVVGACVRAADLRTLGWTA